MVKTILVALDVTQEVVDEAVTRKADLIVSHHPLLFRPPSSLSDSDRVGNLALFLAERGIALYSAHTNLDSARGGVNFALAQALGLEKTRFLMPMKDALVKLAVFVPEDYVERVQAAIADAGAGIIGEYDSCSFQLKGKGTFRGSEHTQPFSGKARRLETVEEVRLEMVVPRARVSAAVASMKAVHPYEEVAYDLYTLENVNPNVGMGVVGELSRAMSVRAFLTKLKKSLSVEAVRFSGSLTDEVKRVAVCGGNGSDLLEDAIRAKADLFVTADIRYHAFHAAVGRIVLVDAGHFETEQVVLRTIAGRLRSWGKTRGNNLAIYLAKNTTNPIHIY